MTYSKGKVITANDFNSFAGSTAVAATSSATATNVAGYLWGVGYGDRGYGEISTLSAKGVGAPLIGSDWAALHSIVSNLAAWQGTSISTLLAASQLAPGKAGVISSFDTILPALDTNRFNYIAGNMSLATNTATTTRQTVWGAGSSGITCEFSITFTSEDAARYFFNTGGEVRIGVSHPSTTTLRNSSWNTILSGLMVAFRANGAARIGGNYGTAAQIGYYQLTTAYQVILDGTNIGISPYQVNDFYVEARATSITGLNGAKGSVIYFRVRLNDEQDNAWGGTVDSGTIANVNILRAISSITKPLPSCATVTNF